MARRWSHRQLRADFCKKSPLAILGALLGGVLTILTVVIGVRSCGEEEKQTAFAEFTQTIDRDRLQGRYPFGWQYIYLSSKGLVQSEPKGGIPGVSWAAAELVKTGWCRRGVKFDKISLYGAATIADSTIGEVNGGRAHIVSKVWTADGTALTLCGEVIESPLDGEILLLGVEGGQTNCRDWVSPDHHAPDRDVNAP